jgi:hypothetical protein
MILLLCLFVAASIGCAAFILCACALVAASAPPGPTVRVRRGMGKTPHIARRGSLLKLSCYEG